MDFESNKLNLLEQMLRDENKEPTDLPLSLLTAITNNFNKGQIIGSGGFADVYKGLLQNGSIAVKRLYQAINMDESSFNKEVNNLIKVKHKNIVRFLGYCSDTQGKVEKYNGKMVMADVRQRLLCFEFIPNGSLDKYINDASGALEWRTWYQIIKGICEGLHYLHQINIVHLDLKPANILLNYSMVPKIADFGLSRCFDENQTRAVTAKLVGTPGYIPPESIRDGVITLKYDIYGLGIIITEILTGRKECRLIKDVLESWNSRFRTSQRGTWREYARVCAELGLRCKNEDPIMRPTMQNIIETLDNLERTYGSIEADISETPICPVGSSDDFVTEKLLDVYPQEVCFHLEANRSIDIECPVTLTNKADHEVGVWIAPAFPDRSSSSLDFPCFSKLQTLEDHKGSTLFCTLWPHSSMVIFMTMINQQQQQPLQAHADMYDVVMFTPKRWTDLKKFELHLTNAKSEEALKRIEELGTEVYRVALRVVTTRDKLARQEAVTTRQFIPASQKFGDIGSIDVHPTETWVLLGHSGGYASIWNHEMRERVMVFQVTDHRICSTKFIAREHWFAVGDSSGSIRVYDYTRDKVKEFEAHHGRSVDMLAVDPTDPLLLTASFHDNMIKLWNWGQGWAWACVRVFEAHQVRHLMIGPRDTNTFACSSSDGIKIWNFTSSDHIAIFEGYTQPYFYTDNHQHFIMAFLYPHEMKTWDLQTKKQVHTLEVRNVALIDLVSYHPTLPILATTTEKSIFLWDTMKYRLMKRFKLRKHVNWMVFIGTGDLTRLVAGCSEGILIFKINSLVVGIN